MKRNNNANKSRQYYCDFVTQEFCFAEHVLFFEKMMRKEHDKNVKASEKLKVYNDFANNKPARGELAQKRP